MSRSWASYSLVVLAACNGLLGLDDTVRDSDGDGVPDDVDNCPTTFNPDQADYDHMGPGDACTVCLTPVYSDLDGDGFDDGCDMCLGPGPTGVDVDGDGIDDGCDPCVAGVSRFAGDANHDGIEDGCEWCMGGGVGIDIDHDGLDDSCDHCLNGPPHDEDGDGVEDGCDNCPALANPGQEGAAQGYLRGSACATSNAPLLSLFDAFLVERAAWTDRLPPKWTVAHDQLVVGGAGDVTATSVSIPSSFIATTRLRFMPAGAGPRIGILATIGPQRLTCELAADGTLVLAFSAGTVDNSTAVLGVDVSGAVTVAISAQRGAGPLVSQAICTATGADGKPQTTPTLAIPDPPDGWNPGLTATDVTAAFDFFEVASTVQSGPF